MRRPLWLVLLVGCMVVLGCAAEDNSDGDGSPDATTVAPQPTATVGLNARLELETQFAQLQAVQVELETLWRDLQAGRSVSCAQDLLPRISPTLFDDASDELSQALHEAASALERSREVWEVECGNPRQQPAAAVVSRGLSAALTAKTALDTAQTLLLPAETSSDN
jgi:hypothetical protein